MRIPDVLRWPEGWQPGVFYIKLSNEFSGNYHAEFDSVPSAFSIDKKAKRPWIPGRARDDKF